MMEILDVIPQTEIENGLIKIHLDDEDGYELSEDNGVDIWLTFGQVREMLRIVSE